MGCKGNGEEENEEDGFRSWLRVILAGSGALMQIVIGGMTISLSSVLLPQLEREDSSIHVTPEEESWIASLDVVLAPIASLMVGPFIDAFGRTKGIQIFYMTTCIGYGVTASAKNVYHIYIGRIICGCGNGLCTFSIVYLVEICTNNQRKYIVALIPALLAGGNLLGSIVGGYLPWQSASLIFCIIAFIILITQRFIPETPPWLFKQGRKDSSIRSLQMLGRSESAIQKEIEALRLSSKGDTETVNFFTFFEPNVWKPFAIMVTFYFLQCAAGLYDIISYSVDLITRLGTAYDPLFVNVILSIVRFLTSSTVTIIFLSRVGRKFSMASSSFGVAVAFAVAGVYEYVLRDVNASDRPFQWIPIASLILFVVASSFGMQALPFIMCGELFSLKVRGTMVAASQIALNIFMFVSIKIYYALIDTFQFYGLLFLFSGFSFIAVLFGIFILPETLSKSLFEIEQSFLPKTDKQPNKGVALNPVRYGSIT